MASMTDVIFLLLIFFMVSSTFIFPTALEVNLPQSSEQTALKPSSRIYIDAQGALYASGSGEDPVLMPDTDALLQYLQTAARAATEAGDPPYIAVYADETVSYGRLIEVLDLGARNNLNMVLATKPAPASATPQPSTSETDAQ